MTEPEICETNLIIFLKGRHVLSKVISVILSPFRAKTMIKNESVFEFVIFKFTSALVAF